MGNQNIKKSIEFMYKMGFSFEDMKNIGYSYYHLIQEIHHLYQDTKDPFYKQEYLDHCYYDSLEDASYLIIGDNHMGSKSERKDYLRQALDVAKARNIKTVFHGGDLGDGMIDPSHQYNSYRAQISHIINDFPEDDEITYYITLGNHDKKYEQRGGTGFRQILEKERKDIHVLGKDIGYVKICSHLVSVEHGTNAFDYLENWYPTPDMRLVAHEHRLSLGKSICRIPALCRNDISDFKNIGKAYRPGFLVLTIDEMTNYDIFGIEGYQFEKEELMKTQESSFYKKKVKK